MRREEKNRQELQAKLAGISSQPLMKLNSWRGWKVCSKRSGASGYCYARDPPQHRQKALLVFLSAAVRFQLQVAHDVWKKPEEATGSEGVKAKVEGGKTGGDGLVRRRKPKGANQLQALAISSRTLFKSYMLSAPQQPSAPRASVQVSRNVHLEPLDKNLQGTSMQRNREPPGKASGAAEPIRRNAAGAHHQSLIEDPSSSLAPPHEPSRTRAAPPGRLELPQEDSNASGSAMSPSLSVMSPSLSLLVSPLRTGPKHPQQPVWGNTPGQSPKPGHQGQASKQPSRFRPLADAPQLSRCSSHPS